MPDHIYYIQFEINCILFRSIVSQSCPWFIVSYFSSSSSNFRISGVTIGSNPDFSIASGNFAGDAVAMQTLLPELMKIEICTVFDKTIF